MKPWIPVYCCLPLLAAADSYERGLAAKGAGELPRATRELAAAVQRQPRNAEAWFHYGTVLGWQKRYAEALAALEHGLQIAPNDYDLRLARARVRAWMGDHAAAARELETLAAEQPADDEVRIMQGRVAGWQKRPNEAERHYQAVLARNPLQIDALTGLGDLNRDRHQRVAARGYYETALAVEDSPEVRARLEQLDADTFRRLDSGFSTSTFAGSSRSDWWGLWTQLSYQAESGAYWGRIEQAERFDQQDTQLELGWEGNSIAGWRLRVLAGGSPDADWAARGFGEIGARWEPDLGPAWVVDLRHAQYVPRGVTTLRAGIDQDFGDGWRICLRGLHQEFENGNPTEGWIASLERELRDGWWWRIGSASGAESLTGESVERSGDALRSYAWFAGLRGPLADNWGWRMDVEFEKVDGGIDRRGISAAITHRF